MILQWANLEKKGGVCLDNRQVGASANQSSIFLQDKLLF